MGLISPQTRGYFPLVKNRPQEIYSTRFVFGWQTYAVDYQWSTRAGSFMQLKLLATHLVLNALGFVSSCPPGSVWPVAASALCRRGGLGESRARGQPGRRQRFGLGGATAPARTEWFCFLTSGWLPIVGSPRAFSVGFQPEFSQKTTKPNLS